MSLDVDVLPVEPLAVVRVSVSAGPSEVWRVTGRADDGSEWLAGEGTGPAVFADPWAPLGVPAMYRAGAVESGAVLRRHRGQNVLTDLTGRVVVDFLWEKGSGDPWGPQPRHAFLDVPGSRFPSSTSGPVAGAGGGSLTARTVGVHTRSMRGLVEANRPLILLHNAGACRLPECDVPAARTVLVTSVSANLTSRMDRAERAWAIEYVLQPRPYRFLAPVATCADVPARWATCGDLAASGLTIGDVTAGDWLVEW